MHGLLCRFKKLKTHVGPEIRLLLCIFSLCRLILVRTGWRFGAIYKQISICRCLNLYNGKLNYHSILLLFVIITDREWIC